MGPNVTGTGPAEIELAGLESGYKARLVCIRAGLAMKERLAAMGLIPGTLMAVIQNQGRGRMIVEVRGTRIMLGRGISNKIHVRIVQ